MSLRACYRLLWLDVFLASVGLGFATQARAQSFSEQWAILSQLPQIPICYQNQSCRLRDLTLTTNGLTILAGGITATGTSSITGTLAVSLGLTAQTLATTGFIGTTAGGGNTAFYMGTNGQFCLNGVGCGVFFKYDGTYFNTNVGSTWAGDVLSTGKFSSSAASGAVAYNATVQGADWAIGPSGPYLWSGGSGVLRIGSSLGGDQASVYASQFGGGTNPVKLSNQSSQTVAGRQALGAHYNLTDNGTSGTPSVGFLINQAASGSFTNPTYMLKLVNAADGNGVGGTNVMGVRGENAALGRIDVAGTDSSGSPGAVTINKSLGCFAVAAAASSVVVTDSAATATSPIFISPMDLDATCTGWKVTRAAGSFTVTMNAACTAAWKACFILHEVL